jgi:PAS domain S-box-containing protein
MSNLFANMTEGFALSKMVYDSKGEPVDYVTLQANQAWEELTGIKKETAIGRKITAVIQGLEKDPANWIGKYGKVATTGESTNFEAYAQQLDKWYAVTAYSPRKGYFVTIFFDISKRKKAEEALKQSEERFRAVQENSLDRFTILKPFFNDQGEIIDFTFVYQNARAAKSTGRKPEELVGVRMTEVYPTFPQTRFFSMYKRAFETRQAIEFENPYQADRVDDWFHVTITPISDGIAITTQIITERKKAEEKLEEYSKNLEKLVEERTKQLKESERLAAIGATAGMVGHDIRNPLQAITGDVYLAKSELNGLPDCEEKQAILESLIETERNIDYINKIVQDLQDYARPLNPNPGEADLKLIIDKLLLKNGLPENVKVIVKVEPDAAKIVADSDYLNRIMYNLVTNAVQAMPKGGKLTIQAYKEVNDVIIAVKDTGVGIPEAIRSKLFTPMFTTKSKGQGFGLPVVKRMTESLGGTVRFESQEGKGTTFTIRLPPAKS